MKNIKTSTYENLTNNQRIIASIEAMARDDENEIKKLVQTCPKKSYTQADAKYSDTMERLMDLAIFVECELRGHAINFYMSRWLESIDDKSYFKYKMKFLQDIADITQAWRSTLEKMGVSTEAMKKVTKALHHEPVIALQDMMPEPNLDKVSEYEIIFDRILK